MENPPISVADALQVIRTLGISLGRGDIGVVPASTHYLAADVFAPRSLPPFDNSQMDGYALSGLPPDHVAWQVVGTTPAGDPPGDPLVPGQAQRVFTGSPVPEGTEAVVMQEVVRRTDARIEVTADIAPGQFIRRAGSDLKVGDRVAPGGTRVDPPLLGLFASLGITSYPVLSPIQVGLFTSGNELVPPGTEPAPHQIIEGNTAMLTGALQQLGITRQRAVWAPDDPDAMAAQLRELVDTCQVVITTGGVSVGDYDHLHEVLHRIGATTLFWRVRQRPGKPLLLAKRSNTIIVGLPGNPVSALVGFYVYVWPLLQHMRGLDSPDLLTIRLPLVAPVKGLKDLTQFLRGRFEGDSVRSLEKQGSHQLSGFAGANCLIRIPEGDREWPVGTPVDCLLLPFA